MTKKRDFSKMGSLLEGENILENTLKNNKQTYFWYSAMLVILAITYLLDYYLTAPAYISLFGDSIIIGILFQVAVFLTRLVVQIKWELGSKRKKVGLIPCYIVILGSCFLSTNYVVRHYQAQQINNYVDHEYSLLKEENSQSLIDYKSKLANLKSTRKENRDKALVDYNEAKLTAEKEERAESRDGGFKKNAVGIATHIGKLQQRYQQDLQIINVTYESDKAELDAEYTRLKAKKTSLETLSAKADIQNQIKHSVLQEKSENLFIADLSRVQMPLLFKMMNIQLSLSATELDLIAAFIFTFVFELVLWLLMSLGRQPIAISLQSVITLQEAQALSQKKHSDILKSVNDF